MYLLKLIQNGVQVDLALFRSIEEGRSFAEGLPGYRLEKLDDAVFESLEVDRMPDYAEMRLGNELIPISRGMFPEEEEIEIRWIYVPDGSGPSGVVEGTATVGSYLIDNRDLKEYVQVRERKVEEIISALEKISVEARRDYGNSEDGEALLIRKRGEDEWHFLCHLDPEFVYSLDTESILREAAE